MTLRIDQTVYRAFEEKHSPSLNLGTWHNPMPSFGRQPSQLAHERITDYPRTAEFGENRPSPSVLLEAITQLALNRVRSRTNSYRVRRESSRSSKDIDSYYCPRSENELCYSALDTWTNSPYSIPLIVRSGKGLHPATQALLEIAAQVCRLERRPTAHSREEYECLDDRQLLRNFVAEGMRAWYSVPSNQLMVKDWGSKHALQKRQFIETWTAKIRSGQFQLLRLDLHYEYRGEPDKVLCSINKDAVKSDIARLRQALETTARFQGSLIGFFPYADLTVTWMIPCVMLVPSSQVLPQILLNDIGALWREISGDHHGRFETTYRTLQGDFRYTSSEQQMLESTEAQLMRAATYLFDTRLILDSSLESLSD